jgi:hypothetical protein
VIVVCASCGRRGRFAVARLIEKYEDTPMPDLLTELTKCPKWQSFALYAGRGTGSSLRHVDVQQLSVSRGLSIYSG